MAPANGLDDGFLIEPIRRAAMLRRLAAGPASREELQAELDVSKATLHRIVTGFSESGIVRQAEAGVELTGAGRAVWLAARQYLDHLETVARLAPLLNGLPPRLEFDAARFADAEVVTPAPGHPHRPVQRVVDFVEEAASLRATASVVLPIYVEVLSREIATGMETELVVAPAVIEALEAEYPDRFTDALDSGKLDLYVTDTVEVGLALDGDRALVVATADGVAQATVVADQAEAVAWTESIYDRYLGAAEPLRRDREPAG